MRRIKSRIVEVSRKYALQEFVFMHYKRLIHHSAISGFLSFYLILAFKTQTMGWNFGKTTTGLFRIFRRRCWSGSWFICLGNRKFFAQWNRRSGTWKVLRRRLLHCFKDWNRWSWIFSLGNLFLDRGESYGGYIIICIMYVWNNRSVYDIATCKEHFLKMCHVFQIDV